MGRQRPSQLRTPFALCATFFAAQTYNSQIERAEGVVCAGVLSGGDWPIPTCCGPMLPSMRQIKTLLHLAGQRQMLPDSDGPNKCRLDLGRRFVVGFRFVCRLIRIEVFGFGVVWLF